MRPRGCIGAKRGRKGWAPRQIAGRAPSGFRPVERRLRSLREAGELPEPGYRRGSPLANGVSECLVVGAVLLRVGEEGDRLVEGLRAAQVPCDPAREEPIP